MSAPSVAASQPASLFSQIFEAKALRRFSPEGRAALLSGLFAALVFIPYLGAVGLWDCWETHYGEVAREMIARRDFVHPYWENAWFFSKPVFTMWMQSVGMQLVAANAGAEKLGLYTEWGFRMPFALFSILAATLLSYALARVVSVRAGLAASFVLCTMPLYFLETRQAITDIPVVASLICTVACAIVALLDKKSPHRAGWWYAAYVFAATGTLAKGLLGFGIPMVVYLAYFALNKMDWSPRSLAEHGSWLFRHGMLQIGAFAGAFAVVGGIATSYASSSGIVFMSTKELTSALPITAPGWFGIMWGSLAGWAAATVANVFLLKRVTERPPTFWAQAIEMRLGRGILLFLAVALPWYYRMFTFGSVDDEGKLFWFRFLIHDHFSRLGAGVHTTTPGGNFTYFIEQGGYAIFPWVFLVPVAAAIVSRFRLRADTAADHVGLIAVLWMAIVYALVGASATKFHHYVFPMLPPMAILMGLALDKIWDEGFEPHALPLLLGVPLFFLVGKDLASDPKNFTDLFVYNYDRPYPMKEVAEAALSEWSGVQSLMARFGAGTPKDFLKVLFASGGMVCGVFALSRMRSWFFHAGFAFVAIFALWFNWSHWVKLSHHWTQRDQLWRYYDQRQPTEPITSFLMNWRGETFYSRNTVKQIKDNNLLFQYAQQPGRKWALVEHYRLGILKNAIGPNKNINLIDKDLNNKFVLLTID